MKNIFYILLLLPTIIFAQYPSNSGQKITLGEQTTADGLVFRGVASIDTVTATSKITRANKEDTSAFLLLDTVTNLLWHYKTASNGWIQAGGSTLDTATMLLPYYRAGRNTIIQAADVPTLNQNTTGSAATLTTGRTIQTNLASTSAATFNGSANITPGVTGTLPVANGGTGASTFTAGSVVFAGASGTYTQDNTKLFWDNTNKRLGIGTASPTATLDVRGIINQTGSGNVDNKFESTTNSGRIIQGLANDQGSGFQQGIFGSSNSQTLFGRTAERIAFMYTAAYSGTYPSVFVIGTFSNQDLILGTNNTQRILIESGGAVTINNLAGSGSRAVNASATGVLSASSSILIKENVENINYGLSDVLKLKPVIFNYIDKDKWGEGKELGFIAEDVMDIIPESTGTMNNSDIYFDLQKLIPVLTKAIQEQNALIKALEQRIINLENK